MASGSRAPRWARALLRFVAPGHRMEDVLGDLEEAHRDRVARRGRARAWLATSLDAVEMALRLLASRIRRRVPPPRTPAEAAAEDALSGAAVSWLDFKLGLRMLFKYPGLTLVAGGTIALAIAMGVGTFEFVTDFLYPRLPLDEGDRIVQIRQLDTSEGSGEPRILHDYVAWREAFRSVDEIGAFQSYRRTLRSSEGQARVLTGAAMTASAFGIARVPPLLGRPLLESDEAPDGAAVALIGYEAWHTLFGGDRGVIGTTARLGSEPVTIVGVMPEWFGWPWAHGVWTPLRVDVLDYERGEGPAIEVVARLADGVDLDEAGAELEAVALRAAADHPETHEHLRPEIRRYGRVEGVALSIAAFSTTSVFFGMLLLLVCGNVGLLLFARTAAREREIVVRSALGAGRGRIVGQLFAEALVLGGLAAALGLWGAHLGLAWVLGMVDEFWADQGQLLGFWTDASLSPIAVIYALAWTVFAAVISGVLPALRITGRQVQPRLQRTGVGGSGVEFGRLWTGVIVTQVAVTVAFVPIVILLGGWTAGIRSWDYGFPAEEYVSLEIATDREVATNPAIDRPPVAADERYRSASAELRRRIASELDLPVTLVGELPGAWYRSWRIEVEGPDGLIEECCPQAARVDADFFEVVGVPLVSGRGFDAADLERGSRVAVVNEGFVREVLGGRDAVGRRLAFVRYGQDPAEPREWHEIVGVAAQIAMTIDPERTSGAGIYVPLGPDVYPLRMAAHVGADPLSVAPRLHRLAAEVDPELQLAGIRPLNESAFQLEMTYTAWFWVVLAAGGAGLLLANAGIYAIMSFTVSRRTREIGVRVALGADRRRIVWGVFARTLKQVGLGVFLGGLIFAALVLAGTEFSYMPRGRDAAILAAYLAAMLGACLIACLVPTRRALRIEPTEALREEG